MWKQLVAVLCGLASWMVIAQTQPEAEAVFQRYVEATKSYDARGIASLMHPDALKRVRVTMDAALAGSRGDVAKRELLPLFAVTSVTEFNKLTDVDAYRRLNETMAKQAPEIVESMSKATYEIIGSVLKNGLAYITYDLKMPILGKMMTTQGVQMLKTHNGEWLLMLPSTSEATIAGIERRYQ